MRFRLILVCALAAVTLRAQTTPQDLQATAANSDRTITFRYKDPSARSVLLQFDTASQPIPLIKDANGVWTFTTAALAPALYNYSLSVDGEPRIDPSNHVVNDTAIGPFYQSVEVAADTPQPWDLVDVPHGELHTHRYTTHIVKGLLRNQSAYVVYTPPGFDPRSSRTYPVLYLLHGWSATETGWTDLRAPFILDTLIAQNKAVPMIVVMPLGYGDMSFLRNGFGVWNDPAAVAQNVQLFAAALLTEVLPQVEASYPVLKDRRNRAIAGLSMGGLESLLIGLNDTAQFAFIGGFSSAVLGNNFEPFVPRLDPQAADLSLLWIACGTGDDLITPNRAFSAYLKQRGLPVTEVETPGRHVAPVWRDNLVHFVPLLFRSNQPGKN